MRTLAVSIGNTTIFCGVFAGERLISSSRLPADARAFARWAARRRPGAFGAAVLCSVVPKLTRPIAGGIERRFGRAPLILTADSAHGLAIGYRRPRELGADRLAAAIGARRLFPRRNLIVVDCGTATTVTALRRDGRLMGGAILPGLALWPEMLAARTAKLPRVRLRRPGAALGRSPREGIASGVYFGHLGAIRELAGRIRREAFGGGSALVIGTGGHAPILAGEGIFSTVEPELILHGLRAFSSVLG